MSNMLNTRKVAWWVLIPLILLLAVYGMLSYLAFVDPAFWYDSMGIPTPEHGFLLLSWGGKNTAMVIGLLLATLSRQSLPILMMMGVFLTGQLGDTVAGAQTGVNVFVTFIGMGLVAVTLILLYVERSRVAVAA